MNNIVKKYVDINNLLGWAFIYVQLLIFVVVNTFVLKIFYRHLRGYFIRISLGFHTFFHEKQVKDDTSILGYIIMCVYMYIYIYIAFSKT
jgi:hypothetical protein